MREATLINEFRILHQKIDILQQQLKIIASGDVLHQEVLKDILIDKNIMTEPEFKEYISKRLAKMPDEEATRIEEEKKKLIKPTSEETAKIKASKSAETKVEKPEVEKTTVDEKK